MRGRMMRDSDLAALTSQNEPIVRWFDKIGCVVSIVDTAAPLLLHVPGTATTAVVPVVRPAGISIISGTYSSTLDFWIMYNNLQIHAMRATFHIVFSVRI